MDRYNNVSLLIQYYPTSQKHVLNPFDATGFFYTPWKHQKTFDFLMYSGSVERDQLHEMG